MVDVLRISGPFIDKERIVLDEFTIDAVKRHIDDEEDYIFEHVGNIIGVHDSEGDHDYFYILQP